jgi:hypothetical protein
MPTLSMSFREAFNAENTDEFPVVLVEITPAGSEETQYLCSEPAVMLAVDPMRYGIVHQGQEYQWVLMSQRWPGDQEASSPSSTLVFENVVEDMAAAARSVTPGTQADVIMSLVVSSDPDTVEERYVMKATGASGNAQQVTLDVSSEPIELEPWPAQRMTKVFSPALFR